MLERQDNSGRNWKDLSVHAPVWPKIPTQHLVLENAPKTWTALHCRGQLLPSIPIRDSQAHPGLFLGGVQHCQGFIMKHDMLWAGWMDMISVGAALISGKSCFMWISEAVKRFGRNFLVHVAESKHFLCMCECDANTARCTSFCNSLRWELTSGSSYKINIWWDWEKV